MTIFANYLLVKKWNNYEKYNKTGDKMLSKLNKKAWNIRRNSAKRFGCPVMEISWKECLRMAKQATIGYLNKICKAFTASPDFSDLISVNENYNPTFWTSRYPDMLILANAFDYYMYAFGKPNRSYRC